MVSAEPFTGKTLLSLAIAIALDTGRPLFSHYHVREPKKVFFIGQDAPSWDYAEQTRKLIRGYALSRPEIDRLDLDMMLNEGLNLFDPGSWKLIQEWWTVSKFNVLILDTLASLHSGDENSTRDMGILCAMLKEIRDKMHCCVIFTHHSAKPLQGVHRSENYSARGNSVISGSIDFHLVLRREPELDRVKLRFPKGRGAERMDKLTYFDIKEDATPEGEPMIRLVVPQANSLNTQIIAALTAHSMSRAELISSIHDPTTNSIQLARMVDNSLTGLERSGQVKRLGRGTWSLP